MLLFLFLGIIASFYKTNQEIIATTYMPDNQTVYDVDSLAENSVMPHLVGVFNFFSANIWVTNCVHMGKHNRGRL